VFSLFFYSPGGLLRFYLFFAILSLAVSHYNQDFFFSLSPRTRSLPPFSFYHRISLLPAVFSYAPPSRPPSLFCCVGLALFLFLLLLKNSFPFSHRSYRSRTCIIFSRQFPFCTQSFCPEIFLLFYKRANSFLPLLVSFFFFPL